MKKKLKYIKSKGFIIDDEARVIKYLENIDLYKLSRYFINFKEQKNADFQEILNHYHFDLELRNLNLGILEVIENSLKSQFIKYVGDKYNDPETYVEKYREERINYNNEKIDYFRGNDIDVIKVENRSIPCYMFVDKLTFGEIVKIFRNLNHGLKYKIGLYYGFKNIHIFQSWIFALRYLRNLSSHGENIFNREMIDTIKGKRIEEKFGLNKNNVYVSYFSILSIFNNILQIDRTYEDRVFEKMQKYEIDFNLFGTKKKQPSVFGHKSNDLEAWKVLVQSLYDFYIKKSNKKDKKILSFELGILNEGFKIKKVLSDKKIILITGGTGYIGIHAVVAFEQTGYKTVIVDNLCNSSLKSLDGVEKILGYKPDFYEVDLRDKNNLENIFKKYNFDGVLHFAGLKAVGESCEKPLKYYDNNVGGSIKLFECMEKYGVKNIVFSSSATVYNPDNSIPYVEGQNTGVTTNSYGTTKLLTEKILEDLSKFSGFRVMNLRYFNPIGAHKSGFIGENPNGIPNNLLPYIFKVVAGDLEEVGIFGNDYDTIDGTGVRDYIDIVDLVEGHLKAYEKINSHLIYPKGEKVDTKGFFKTYNLGTGKGISVLEMVKSVEKIVEKEIKYIIKERRKGDLAEFYSNPKKANIELGWKARISLEESLENGWRFVNKE